jgi:hypothetical protein
MAATIGSSLDHCARDRHHETTVPTGTGVGRVPTQSTSAVSYRTDSDGRARVVAVALVSQRRERELVPR